ncbi:MAG TPA: hypothetical protein VH000_09735 [Rhizomicrobium sp.]|nr:hypothetical protein [Rhizomicrobium sp.]
MKIRVLAGAMLALQLVAMPTLAAADTTFERLAVCKDSWLDMQTSSPAQMKKIGDYLRANFTHKDNDAFFTPKGNESIAGFRVLQLFPQSAGMGVGFSATIAAPFDKARATFEKSFGKPLTKCDASDGMKTCELDIAEKRTFTLMADDRPGSAQTLVGCYYYYEK